MKQNQNHLLTKEEKRIDVTKETLPKVTKRYRGAIKKVEKVGSEYEITFAEGYTIFNQTMRKSKNISGILWYSRIATEEKQEGKFDFEKWKKNFDENKIVWDGKNIPEYILTQKQIDASKKRLAKEKVSKSS